MGLYNALNIWTTIENRTRQVKTATRILNNEHTIYSLHI